MSNASVTRHTVLVHARLPGELVEAARAHASAHDCTLTQLIGDGLRAVLGRSATPKRPASRRAKKAGADQVSPTVAPPRNQVGLRMDRPLPGSTDNGGPGVPARGRLVGTTDETPAAHWTAGPRCPKCGWMLRAGRCANKECR